ncbi:hypothetical protein Cgig2_005294 [Carnegiea gigantea]|uniref:Uncharacterized protein n=1 Tax=Carnegiea gigantea TaxID=171969 RepID=A0A9Q1JN54_9CARY|nr:hypothetical protein Cgig2_005294 [Carnegiea gigantea]
MTELEELIPGARSPLKRVRNVAAESVSDALINDRSNRPRSRTLVLSQDSFESDGFPIQIYEIEKNYMGSRDKVHDFPQFDVPSFSLGVSQEEKQALPEGIVVVDSQPDDLAAAMQIPNVQTPTNTDKGKDVLVEALKRHRMRSTQCYIPLESNEEVPPKENVDDKETTDKAAERAIAKEALPEKLVKKRSKKTDKSTQKTTKKKTDKKGVLRRKAVKRPH